MNRVRNFLVVKGDPKRCTPEGGCSFNEKSSWLLPPFRSGDTKEEESSSGRTRRSQKDTKAIHHEEGKRKPS